MFRQPSSFGMQFLVGRPIVILEMNRLLQVEVTSFDITRIGLNRDVFPSVRKRSVLSPLHIQSRTLSVTMGVLNGRSRDKVSAVKVRREFDDFVTDRIVANPHYLVIA